MGYGWCACWASDGKQPKSHYYPADASFCIENKEAGTSYSGMGNGWCMSGNQKVGLRHNWFNQPESFCQELCNNHAECTGYIVKDNNQCDIMPGTIGGENVKTITGANREFRYKCMRKVVNIVEAMFGATGVTNSNLQNFCRAISVTLGGNTQYCSLTDSDGIFPSSKSPNTVYMTIGVDDCRLATQQIGSYGFSGTVQDLPAGTSISSNIATGCDDGTRIDSVPYQTTTTTVAKGQPIISTFTMDGRYHVGALRKHSEQLERVFAHTLGVPHHKVSVDIQPAVVQFRVTDTKDYTKKLSTPSFRNRLIDNFKKNEKLSDYLGLSGDGAVECEEMETAQDCWGYAKPAKPRNGVELYIPSGMMEVCTWIPGINRCQVAGVAPGMSQYDPTENEVNYENMFGPGVEPNFENVIGFDTYHPLPPQYYENGQPTNNGGNQGFVDPNSGNNGFIDPDVPHPDNPFYNPRFLPGYDNGQAPTNPSSSTPSNPASNPSVPRNPFLYEDMEEYCEMVPATPAACKRPCVLVGRKCELFEAKKKVLQHTKPQKSHPEQQHHKTFFIPIFVFIICALFGFFLMRCIMCRKSDPDINSSFVALEDRV